MRYDFKKKLYLITDERLLPRKNFILKIKEAAAAGIDLIQIREKISGLNDRAELVKKAVKTAHAAGVRVIINDDPFLAAWSGADGVHLGEKDPGVAASRSILGAGAIIGVSCYGDLKRAFAMEKAGADYVSFGNFYLSPTKPLEKIISLKILREAKNNLKVPVVAIGGIKPENSGELFRAGADCLSVVSSVLSSKKIAEAVKKFEEFKKGDKHDKNREKKDADA